MNKISSFREKPKLRLTWAAFAISLASLLLLAAFVIIMLFIVYPDPKSEPAWLKGGGDMVFVYFSIASGLLSLGMTFNAFNKGEHSWAAFSALTISLISLIAWTLLIVF